MIIANDSPNITEPRRGDMVNLEIEEFRNVEINFWNVSEHNHINHTNHKNHSSDKRGFPPSRE